MCRYGDSGYTLEIPLADIELFPIQPLFSSPPAFFLVPQSPFYYK